MCDSILKCHDHTADLYVYIPMNILVVMIGVLQIISGIFYYITIPVIKLILNVFIGCWAILTGIGGGMVACVCESSPRKHEFLLYCSLSVLVLNTINLVILEFGQFKELFSVYLHKPTDKEYELLEYPNGRLLTSAGALGMILLAFLQSQITFCLLNKSQRRHHRTMCLQKKRRMYLDNDQTADAEYVIPKKPEANNTKDTSIDTTVQVYAKSWVFEGSAEANHMHDNLSNSITSSSISPTHSNNSTSFPIEPPKKMHQRRISKLSDVSERYTNQMTSFSRCATPSPVPHSGQQTPTMLQFSDYNNEPSTSFGHHKPSNRLTVDYIAQSPGSGKLRESMKVQSGPSSLSVNHPDDGQFASLLAELELSLQEKKQQNNFSPDETSLTASTDKCCSSSNKSSSKDLEFSKELEAALQLIQELETPSEGPLNSAPLPTNMNIPVRSDSEKTLSAAISLPSPETTSAIR